MNANSVDGAMSTDEPTLLHEIVSAQAAARPDDAALVFDDQPTTFAQLDARIATFAGWIAARTVPGDRVAVVADNHPVWVDAYYGVPRAGAVLALLNHRLGPEQLHRSIARVQPAVLIAGQEQLDALAAVCSPADLAPVVVVIDDLTDLSDGADRDRNGFVADRDDVAWLLPTSGTSGEPKFVPLTHRNLLAALETTSSVRHFEPSHRLIYSFPLCHVAGYNLVLFQSHGCAVVLLPRFEAADFVREVNQHHATNASLAPTMIHSLLDHLDRTGTSVPSIQDITYGASPITGTLLRRAIDTLGADFHQGYGMTESAGIVVFLTPEDHRAGLGDRPDLLRAAGRAAPTIGLRIVDDDGHAVPIGEVGEIVLCGPQVMGAYANAPAINAEAFFTTSDPDDATWFRTGDVGRLDEDGYLSVIDRKKDVIISGGENVSSREVEDLLAGHPDIVEVAAIGVPDARWGELVTAVVVARPGAGLTADDVLAFGREVIGGYQQPRRVQLVDELPRNPSGKVLKHELRARFA
jgi:acyl-CoA synthetase (AMP-forming)/AMP-acid ligase II